VLGVLPGVARAGDSPILTVGDWGVGEIDGKALLYLGEGRHLATPIPVPPRGPRWDLVYRSIPWLALGAGAIGVLRLYRRRAADSRPSKRPHSAARVPALHPRLARHVRSP